MTDDVPDNEATPDPTSVDGVFCDTCVLLNYVQQEWEHDRSSVLLEDDDRRIVIGESVEEEFVDVTDRRRHVYPDFVDFLLEQDGEVGDYTPSVDVPLQSNDHGHVREIQMELAAEDRAEALRRLRRYARRVERKVEHVLERIVDEVVLTTTPFGLGLALGEVIPNDADCRVVEDAAAWTRDGGSGVFVTLDSADVLELVDDINAVLVGELDVRLVIVSPAVFESPQSSV